MNRAELRAARLECRWHRRRWRRRILGQREHFPQRPALAALLSSERAARPRSRSETSRETRRRPVRRRPSAASIAHRPAAPSAPRARASASSRGNARNGASGESRSSSAAGPRERNAATIATASRSASLIGRGSALASSARTLGVRQPQLPLSYTEARPRTYNSPGIGPSVVVVSRAQCANYLRFVRRS